MIAISRDGMVAHRDGTTATIMCPVSRQWADMQRALCDALMIGARTAELDNPHLDIAINGLQDRAYTRVLLLGSHPLPPGLNLIHGVSGHPTIVFTEQGRELDLPPGIEPIGIEARDGRPDLRQAMAVLAQRSISTLQVEGGARLIEAMLAAELADRIHLIQSPNDLGQPGVPVTPLGSIDGRLRAAGFDEKHARLLGDDMLRTFERVF
jgi:diaminohydroxyphosphoribosylaminopyrimidine deaminase/5-amino-6-(5-phosphoribosylamino)uracil reductase